MWKNIIERGKPQKTIWSMRSARWIPKATNTHSEYVILIAFSTATMVAWMRLNITLYVNCLSCLQSGCASHIMTILYQTPHKISETWGAEGQPPTVAGPAATPTPWPQSDCLTYWVNNFYLVHLTSLGHFCIERPTRHPIKWPCLV